MCYLTKRERERERKREKKRERERERERISWFNKVSITFKDEEEAGIKQVLIQNVFEGFFQN